MIEKIMPMSEVRANFSSIIKEIEDDNSRLVVTKNGKPVIVIISYEDLNYLEDIIFERIAYLKKENEE